MRSGWMHSITWLELVLAQLLELGLLELRQLLLELGLHQLLLELELRLLELELPEFQEQLELLELEFQQEP